MTEPTETTEDIRARLLERGLEFDLEAVAMIDQLAERISELETELFATHAALRRPDRTPPAFSIDYEPEAPCPTPPKSRPRSP